MYQGYIEFKNFEIGVLFHSDYTDKRKRYKLLSMSCDVHGDSSSSHENLELNLGGYAQYLGHCKLDSDTILPYDIDEVIHSKTSKGLGCSDCIILPVPFDPLSSECKSFYDDELHCDMEHICNSNSENNLVSCISTSSRSTSIQSSYSISNKQKSIPYFTDFRQVAVLVLSNLTNSNLSLICYCSVLCRWLQVILSQMKKLMRSTHSKMKLNLVQMANIH